MILYKSTQVLISSPTASILAFIARDIIIKIPSIILTATSLVLTILHDLSNSSPRAVFASCHKTRFS